MKKFWIIGIVLLLGLGAVAFAEEWDDWTDEDWDYLMEEEGWEDWGDDLEYDENMFDDADMEVDSWEMLNELEEEGYEEYEDVDIDMRPTNYTSGYKYKKDGDSNYMITGKLDVSWANDALVALIKRLAQKYGPHLMDEGDDLPIYSSGLDFGGGKKFEDQLSWDPNYYGASEVEHFENLDFTISYGGWADLDDAFNDLREDRYKDMDDISETTISGARVLVAKKIEKGGGMGEWGGFGEFPVNCWKGSSGSYKDAYVIMTAYVPSNLTQRKSHIPDFSAIKKPVVKIEVNAHNYSDGPAPDYNSSGASTGGGFNWYEYCVEDPSDTVRTVMSELISKTESIFAPIAEVCIENGFCDYEFGENCQNCAVDCGCEYLKNILPKMRGTPMNYVVPEYNCDPDFANSYYQSQDKNFMMGVKDQNVMELKYACVDESFYDEDVEVVVKDDFELEEPDYKISVRVDKNQLSASGEDEDFVTFTVHVTPEDEAKGDEVSISLESQDDDWKGKVGEPSDDEGVLDGDGEFTFTYKPPQILKGPSTPENIPVLITVKHKESGESDTEKVILYPLGVEAKIRVVEPIQVLRKMPLVAGKKTAVFVAVETTAKAFPDGTNPYLNFRFYEESGAPTYTFEKISLIEDIKDPMVERITDNQGVLDHLNFLELRGSFGEKPSKWYFFQFYVDPTDTKFSGKYATQAELMIEQSDPNTGETKSSSLDVKSTKAPVYASGFMSVKMLPLAIGLWNDDFCEYCEEKQSDVLDLNPAITFGRRIAKNWSQHFNPSETEQRSAGYRFGCRADLFYYSFKGELDKTLVNQQLHKTTVGRLLSRQDYPPLRAACQEHFTDIFLTPGKVRNQDKTKTIMDLLIENNASAVGSDGKFKQYQNGTAEDKYLKLTEESKQYLRAVMPLAEENLYFYTEREPWELPGLSLKTTSPAWVLAMFRQIRAGRVNSKALLAPLVDGNPNQKRLVDES
ncbi:hypothetical protein KJ632_05405, partial [Patescibacteria group bacterium]|nr:hypothetical protein [Patescibacteria group bacterium]